MSLLFRKIALHNLRQSAIKYGEAHIICLSSRNLSIVPSLYDGDKDPALKFFSPSVQVLLKRITRPDYNKVFRKRTNSGIPVLKDPKYKFLTDEELRAVVAKADEQAEKLLQMPPVVKIQAHIDEVLCKDPALIGYDTSTYLFTDITFGVHNQRRFIIQRDPDGTLRSCDHDIRKRLNQVYFPIKGRKLREPIMFTNEERLHSLLDSGHYEFVLDRACIQYEPDESSYQRVTSIAYQHLDSKRKFELLRSTRHFGPLTFYLTWHQSIENLLLELLQSNAVREAVVLVALRHDVHGDVVSGDVATGLAKEILTTPIQLTKLESVTEEDIQLDTKCVECIEKYIASNSSMKSQQELALQGFREAYNQLIEISRGVRKMHGSV